MAAEPARGEVAARGGRSASRGDDATRLRARVRAGHIQTRVVPARRLRDRDRAHRCSPQGGEQRGPDRPRPLKSTRGAGPPLWGTPPPGYVSWPDCDVETWPGEAEPTLQRWGAP